MTTHTFVFNINGTWERETIEGAQLKALEAEYKKLQDKLFADCIVRAKGILGEGHRELDCYNLNIAGLLFSSLISPFHYWLEGRAYELARARVSGSSSKKRRITGID